MCACDLAFKHIHWILSLKSLCLNGSIMIVTRNVSPPLHHTHHWHCHVTRQRETTEREKWVSFFTSHCHRSIVLLVSPRRRTAKRKIGARYCKNPLLLLFLPTLPSNSPAIPWLKQPVLLVSLFSSLFTAGGWGKVLMVCVSVCDGEVVGGWGGSCKVIPIQLHANRA